MRYRCFIHAFLLQSRKRWVRRWKRRWPPISMAVRVATEAWPPHQFFCSTLFSAGPSCEQPWHTCQDSDSDTADTRGIFVVIRPLRLHLAWFPSPTHVTSEGSLPFSTRLRGQQLQTSWEDSVGVYVAYLCMETASPGSFATVSLPVWRHYKNFSPWPLPYTELWDGRLS